MPQGWLWFEAAKQNHRDLQSCCTSLYRLCGTAGTQQVDISLTSRLLFETFQYTFTGCLGLLWRLNFENIISLEGDSIYPESSQVFVAYEYAM